MKILLPAANSSFPQDLKKSLLTDRWDYQWREGVSAITPRSVTLHVASLDGRTLIEVVPANALSLGAILLSGPIFGSALQELSLQVDGYVTYWDGNFFFEYKSGEVASEINQGADWVYRGAVADTLVDVADPIAAAFLKYAPDDDRTQALKAIDETLGRTDLQALVESFSLHVDADATDPSGPLGQLFEKAAASSNSSMELPTFGKIFKSEGRFRFYPAGELYDYLGKGGEYFLQVNDWPSDLTNGISGDLEAAVRQFCVQLRNAPDGRNLSIGLRAFAYKVTFPGYEGRNPKSGEKIIVAPKTVPMLHLV